MKHTSPAKVSNVPFNPNNLTLSFPSPHPKTVIRKLKWESIQILFIYKKIIKYVYYLFEMTLNVD